MSYFDESTGDSDSASPLWWSSLRSELHQWFKERAPSFADGYFASVQILNSSNFPARVHFICHAIRDIYRNLPASLGLKVQARPSEVFPNMVKDLVKICDAHPAELIEHGASQSMYAIAPKVFKQGEKIVKKSKQMSDQPTIGQQLAIALFRSQERGDEFIEPRVMELFDSEYKFFVARAHLVSSIDRVPSDEGLVEHFERFEKAFHSIVGPYFSSKEKLDVILQDTNQQTD